MDENVSSISPKQINSNIFDKIIKVTEAESRSEMKKEIEDLGDCVPSDRNLTAEKDMIVNMLRIFQIEIYDNVTKDVLSKSEMCYRSYIFDPCLKFCTRYLRDRGTDVTFVPGEIELEALTTQSNKQGMMDGRYKYNAEGSILANNFSNLEILLTEVSSWYGSNETGKVSFDHYKAMFGMLAILRTIAQTYSKGSFQTFKKLKVHFIHGHGDAVRHWSMSVQEVGVFLMNKEQRAVVPVDFKEKDVSMTSFIQFYLTVTGGCEESLGVIEDLKKEHKEEIKAENRRSH